MTRWQTLYRSDALHRITEPGAEQFASLGVHTILDLRDDFERRTHTTNFHSAPRIVVSPITTDVSDSIRSPDVTLERLYLEFIDQSGEKYANALRHISTAREGAAVLVHCTAGKDRTGTVIALTLTAIGVDRDDVLHDYAETERLLEGEWADRHIEWMKSHGFVINENLRRVLVQSPVDALDNTLAHIDERYGSVVDYLRMHGLTDLEIDDLAQALLVNK